MRVVLVVEMVTLEGGAELAVGDATCEQPSWFGA